MFACTYTLWVLLAFTYSTAKESSKTIIGWRLSNYWQVERLWGELWFHSFCSGSQVHFIMHVLLGMFYDKPCMHNLTNIKWFIVFLHACMRDIELWTGWHQQFVLNTGCHWITQLIKGAVLLVSPMHKVTNKQVIKKHFKEMNSYVWMTKWLKKEQRQDDYLNQQAYFSGADTDFGKGGCMGANFAH